ncbi:hypothetical protein [Terricaulis silvestris]|uniref:Uncharacterized protein n=1 Tax=Terricaulis silvestris TaxID=2686094 RepID=A0A6I6MMT6_9CAUL|nr:hypothetical protein [Terricaulis silvestris]QGZ96620.1 hypothetical protein DSM104635_03480 [Terricaulis silvestris]
MTNWLDLAQIVGGVATAVGVILAVVTAFFALAQLRISNEIAAQDAYAGLLRNMVDFPEFSPPAYEVVRSDPTSYARYKRYVAYVFTVCERVLLSAGRGAYWRETVAYYVCQHVDHVRSVDFRNNHYSHYSLAMRRVLDSIALRGAQ